MEPGRWAMSSSGKAARCVWPCSARDRWPPASTGRRGQQPSGVACPRPAAPASLCGAWRGENRHPPRRGGQAAPPVRQAAAYPADAARAIPDTRPENPAVKSLSVYQTSAQMQALAAGRIKKETNAMQMVIQSLRKKQARRFMKWNLRACRIYLMGWHPRS